MAKTTEWLDASNQYISFTNGSRAESFVNNAFNFVDVPKGGGTGYANIVIDPALINNGTIDKVEIKHKTRGHRSSTTYKRATVRTGYTDSSGNVQWTTTHTEAVARSGEDATEFTDEVTPTKDKNGKYTLNIGVINNINNIVSTNLTVYVLAISVRITYTPPHTHSYTSTVTKQPACTATGIRTYTCSCGDSYTETISALGHSFGSTTAAKAATCLATGNSAYKKCSRCNLYFAGDAATNSTAGKSDTSSFVIAKKSHSYTGAIKSDGNGKDATHSFKCVNGCNQYGGAVKHTWNSGTVTKQPTCTATGVKTYTCTASGCGATYTETLSAKGHTEVTIPAVAPTCTATGLTEGKKCSVCNTILVAQQTVPALGHDYKSTVIAPTATSIGYTRHTCSRCGDYYDDSFTYFITFKNGDGTTLETVTVAHGNTPKCSKTPTKASTAEYSYTFNNTWSPALGAATANQVYTPNFTATKRSYRVRWFNEDGTLLETDTTLYGVMPTYDGATPTKAATAEFTYTFKGWHVEVKTVTGEFDYYARYTETTNKYKVIWKNDNGDVLEEDETEYGKIPTYDSAEPTKASTAEFTYTFAGWDTAISEVEGDIVYTATYTEHKRSYNLKVSYREAEGEVIGIVSGSYEYNTPLVATAKPKPGYKLLYWVIVSEDGTETTHTSNPLSFGIYCDTTIGAVFERAPIPIKANLEQVTGVYVVPDANDPETGTIVYVISGTIPTVETVFHTVDGWHFLVSNTIPDNSYPLEKLFVTDNKGNTTRIW